MEFRSLDKVSNESFSLKYELYFRISFILLGKTKLSGFKNTLSLDIILKLIDFDKVLDKNPLINLSN